MNYQEVNHHDIHWRNTALLTEFLNYAGLMKNLVNTGLPRWQHKRILKAVRRARILKVLPYTGFIRSFHRMPVKDIYEEIEESAIQIVDLQTGCLQVKEAEKNWIDKGMNVKEVKEALENFNTE